MQSLTHQFLTFCRSKPGDERYCYTSNGRCAFAQFLRHHGYAKNPCVDPDVWSEGPWGEEHPIPEGIDDCLNPSGHDFNTFTFGALADRLEAALAKATSPQGEGSQA